MAPEDPSPPAHDPEPPRILTHPLAVGLTVGALALTITILLLLAEPAARLGAEQHVRLQALQVMLALLVTSVWVAVFAWARWKKSQHELALSRQHILAIAARLEAEKALHESHERLQALAEATFEGLLIHDRGLVIDVNEAFARLFGFKREEALGKPILPFLPPAVQEEMKARLLSPMPPSDAALAPYEIAFQDPEGKGIHLEVRAKAMPYQGRTVHVAAFLNVTERRELERAKSELISVLSHELRGPLGSLHNSLEVLAHGTVGELPERARRMVSVALQSAGRLLRITKQSLEYDQLSTGRRALDLKTCSADDLLRQAAETMQGLAESRGITLSIEADAIPLGADEDLIIQVLVNLLSNALKFAPSGSTVLLTAESSEAGIHLAVRDEGPGISPDQSSRIFEPFVQLEPPDGSSRGGIGLGLSLCKTMVERHGGKITVESVPGQGATFRFTLPGLQSAPQAPERA